MKTYDFIIIFFKYIFSSTLCVTQISILSPSSATGYCQSEFSQPELVPLLFWNHSHLPTNAHILKRKKCLWSVQFESFKTLYYISLNCIIINQLFNLFHDVSNFLFCSLSMENDLSFHMKWFNKEIDTFHANKTLRVKKAYLYLWTTSLSPVFLLDFWNYDKVIFETFYFVFFYLFGDQYVW